MRNRKEIEKDCKEFSIEMNGVPEELLLDIRELLQELIKQNKK